MKKFAFIIIGLVLTIQLIGCSGWAVRRSTSLEPRVDQTISGNRGFLFGKPPTPPKEPTFKERKVYKLEVEIPPLPLNKN